MTVTDEIKCCACEDNPKAPNIPCAICGSAALSAQPAGISRALMGKIIDEVFDGALEDASVIEDIYRVIVREAALSVQPAEAVKPLEWKEGASGTYTEVAESVFGHYSVWEIDGTGCWAPWKQGSGILVDGGIAGAKAAAQADYERRILSALTTPPTDLREENERLTESLRIAQGITDAAIEDYNDTLSRATTAEQRVKALEEENERLRQQVAELDGEAKEESLWRFWNGKARNLADALTTARSEITRLETASNAANREARMLAQAMHEQSYPHVAEWQMLDDTAGIITQISNMAAGIRDRATAAEASLSQAIKERDKAVEETREECAALIDVMLSETLWKTRDWARGALTIAARAIRRGRHLTVQEKAKNALEWIEGGEA
ncbi:hypothetical protein [Gellertiella hungarica]|uniref:DNA-binding transcriptional MerR regulator n=1 Tax=Gellertiella hungarica TaxID=1572859 RepID=A0A7W6NIS0_9HYPH|nr:hypothetical protein [Gellertiella hungarica]MBB4063635.1 DNA-binding transcriptional MerR regulator [Gellertiella hungarica]